MTLETVRAVAEHLVRVGKERQLNPISKGSKDYYRGVEVASATILMAMTRVEKTNRCTDEIKGD